VPSEPEPAANEAYVRRAGLLADLGRYEDAATELGFAVALDPADAGTLTLLSRVRLAAGSPVDALSAADAAVEAAPAHLAARAARAMALLDLRRYREAADAADEMLRLGPDDAYAQTTAAAILGEARNGQRALNAAWRGVELAPEEATAHLVLGVVAARLELFSLAERAYREALRLDPELASARQEIGVIRLEQRRYAEALEHLAEAAAMQARATRAKRTSDVDPTRAVGHGFRRVLQVGAAYALITPILVLMVAVGSLAGSRLWAALLGTGGFVAAVMWTRRLPGSVGLVLRTLARDDVSLGVAVWAVLASPALILLYAAIGGPWPLAGCVAAGMAAVIANVMAR
jgi:tetratricopeptide (TPR) repeat protein